MSARMATAGDVEEVTRVLTGAFAEDPIWSWALPDPERMAVVWRFYVQAALRYPTISIEDEGRAVALWIPPGGSEFTAEDEELVPALIEEQCGDLAADVLELMDRFEAAHPHDRPHYYLSLLGTRSDSRGQGLGMALLAETLARIDAEGQPAYLESTNPANNARYAGAGFEAVGEFTTPDSSRTVTTMWREPA